MKITFLALSALFTAATAFGAEDPYPIGYSDTPFIPGTDWRVHDIKRPAPPVVRPGAKPGDAPSDAIILLDGKDTSQFYSRKKDDPNRYPSPWKIENGELIVNKLCKLTAWCGYQEIDPDWMKQEVQQAWRRWADGLLR